MPTAPVWRSRIVGSGEEAPDQPSTPGTRSIHSWYTRVGQYGLETDVRTPLLAVQAKVRKAFPYWMTRELARLPRSDGRIPILVIRDAPGQGSRSTAIVVIELSDFKDLHGGAI